MPIDQVGVRDAHALQQQGATYVDVRSSREFAAGHPAGALNVPLLEHDEDTGQMGPNPDFMRVMRAVFAPDTPMLLGCQAGGRSLRAAQMLAAAGFTSVTNVAGGFGGAMDRMTGRVEEGWADAGLPVETTAEAGATYAEILARADAAGA